MPIPCPPVKLSPQDHIRYFREELDKWGMEGSRTPAIAPESPPSAPEPEKPVAAPPQDSGFSERLKTHLGDAASKWKEGDIENARKYVEDGDEDAYRALSSIKQSAVTRFAASDAPERARQGEAKARELAGKTITTERGTTYKPQEGYSATEGQGDGLTDLVEDKEDPETGLKTVFSVANPSQEKPEPTEKNPFLYRLHDLVTTLPNGRQQFGGATMDKDGTISRQTWDSKTSNIPKAEKGLYESLVPQAFKGDRVDVKMLDDQLKNLPAVEVHTYGMEGKTSPAKTSLDRMTHEWLDTLRGSQRENVYHLESGEGLNEWDVKDIRSELKRDGVDLEKVDKYLELSKQVGKGGSSDSGPKATSYYKSISPFDTDKYPVQRIDVVAPMGEKMTYQEFLKSQNRTDGPKARQLYNDFEGHHKHHGVLWSPDNLHENLPNTLGWVMAQYVPHPVTGEKTMFIGELQSRWGQERAAAEARAKRLGTPETLKAAGPADHPLLKNWESLALKAAVDTARREGTKSIILSDAESAMMTEGHDKVTEPIVSDTGKNRDLLDEMGLQFKQINPDQLQIEPGKYIGEHSLEKFDGFINKPSQDSGMRAQYDKRGPDILRKLTGDTGKEVDMGAHKNASEIDESRVSDDHHPGVPFETKAKGSPVFKDEAGNPRTNAKGREYDLSKPTENVNRYGVGERGKARLEMVQKSVDDFESANPFIKGKIFVHSNKESLRNVIKEGNPQSASSAQDALDLLDKGSPVAGWMARDGTIHIYPQNAPDTGGGVKRLIEHEIFHRGEEYAKIYAPKEYNQLQKLKGQLDDQQLSRLGDGKYSPIYGDWRTNPESRVGLQTEWITDQIEKGALEKASPDTVLGRIWQTLKDIYSRLTGNKTPSSQQIKDMYRAMTKVQESGRPHPKSPLGETKFSDFKAGVADRVNAYVEQNKDNLDKTVDEVKDAARSVINTAKSVAETARSVPKYTEAKEAVGTLKKGLVQDQSVTLGRLTEMVKAIGSSSKRSALTVYRQADGDLDTLKKWETDTQNINKKFSKAAKDAQSLSDQEKNWADQISDWYEEQGARGVQSGLLPEEVMQEGSGTYANAVWKKKITAAGRDAYNQFVGKLQRNFNFGKKASFENFYEGIMAGLEPKTLDQAHLYSLYDNHMSKVIHSNEFVKNMMAAKTQEGLPMAVIKGVDITGENTGKYKIIDSTLAKRILDQGDQVPYKSSPDPRLWGWKFMGQDTAGKDVMMKGNLAFHPEGFKIVDNMLRRSALKDWAESPSESAVAELAKRAFTVADTLNSGVKAGMFGFSPFHMVQEGTQALGHRFNPLTDLKDFDPANATHLDAVQHGLVLPGMEGQDNDMFEGLTSGGWMHRIPGVGPLAKAVSDNTWKYVRSLKLKGYETVLENNRKTFAEDIAKGKVSDADVKHLSATQMNESFGGLNYQMMGRSPTIQHLMRLSLLAPDFLEARFRASSSALAGLTGAKAGKEQAVALATLAMGSYAIARVLNGILNDGDTKPDHPFSVISGNREYTMRSLPEDMWKAATNTREFAMGRLSPLIARTAIQLATGRNYRGEAVPASETMKEAALAGVPMSLRQIPGLRELTQTSANNPVSPLEGALSTFGLHISKFSPIVSGYELASEFKQQIGKPDTGAYPVSPYTPLKNALEDVDMDRAQAELEKLRQTIPKDKLAKAFHSSLFHQWMGTSEEEKAFLKSLTGENKAILAAAEKRRKDIWKRWLKISGLGRDLPQETPLPK